MLGVILFQKGADSFLSAPDQLVVFIDLPHSVERDRMDDTLCIHYGKRLVVAGLHEDLGKRNLYDAV